MLSLVKFFFKDSPPELFGPYLKGKEYALVLLFTQELCASHKVWV